MWHIPQSWIDMDTSASGCSSTHTGHIVDAAECALRLALVNNAFIDNTQIPLITHHISLVANQTSRSNDPKTWSTTVRACLQKWLAAAKKSDDPSAAEMAWFMWDDDGIEILLQNYEQDLSLVFSALPYPVEKADLSRILVLKWFGGIVSADRVPLSATIIQLTFDSMAILTRSR